MKDYKKILEGVVNIINTAEKSDIGFSNICTYIDENCPELKESEDERIRKEIRDFFSRIMLGQENFLREDYDWNAWIAWIEKQAKQKHVDNVEPKFKVGDFIVNDYCMGRIVEITNDAYLLDTEQGIPFSGHSTRLWDITKDANDGDVLVVYNIIFIYKRTLSNHIVSYCKLINNIFEPFGDARTCCESNSRIHHATKEQCDFLFQKMKEAGYMWDAEKKELKKIEQKPAFEMKTPEESLGIDSDTYNKIVDECIYGEQKPTDNVEPKFHEGEWIIHQGTENIYQVVARIDNQYQLKYGDNYTIQKCADVDRCARLWDIAKDAKDGDVLFTSSTASHETFIFKNIDEKGNAKCYFAYDSEDGFREGKYHFIGRATKCKPATKEQRYLLFQKMHESGYEWDAEKKSIVDLKKKVELKPFDKVVVRCSEADRWSIDFFSYKAPNGYICTGDAWFGYCLPYNEETAKLIGTTINMEV